MAIECLTYPLSGLSESCFHTQLFFSGFLLIGNVQVVGALAKFCNIQVKGCLEQWVVCQRVFHLAWYFDLSSLPKGGGRVLQNYDVGMSGMLVFYLFLKFFFTFH